MNIILFGFKGSGKTYLGKMLSRRLERPFVDTDDLIAQKHQKPIRELYRSVGEAQFREIESCVVREIASLQHHVIALGGGTLLCVENRKILEKMGRLIYLKASFNLVEKRIFREGIPLFVQGKEQLSDIYCARNLLYASIPAICVDVDSLDGIDSWPQTLLDKFLGSPHLGNPMDLSLGL